MMRKTRLMVILGALIFEVLHTGEPTSYLIKLGYRVWNW